jgi:hypothetical protein
MWETTLAPMLLAFAKRSAAIEEKECPGWAALSEAEKARLRTLAAEEPAVR